MVYEGNVKVIADDGSAFTFDSPEAVSWLQMYVDMVAAGTVDNAALTTKDDRVGLLIFSAGQAPFYQTGPNLIREVKANNAQLYEDLAIAPAPVGKSGVIGKGLMGMSVKADTQFPNASMALAQFFTNARTLTELAKQSAVYPSSPKAFEDPYFSSQSELIEDSARGTAGETIAKYADIVPTIPNKGDVNAVVLAAVEQALFGGVPAQQALTDAVAEANKLLD
jgi:ABC-type glycerol-3-phosphate transport system substrate-binding protein